MKTGDEIRKYLKQVLETFVTDPADSDYQEGYFQALAEVERFALDMPSASPPQKPITPPRRAHLRLVEPSHD